MSEDNIKTQVINELVEKYNYIDYNYICPIDLKKSKLYKIDFSKLTIDYDNNYPKYYYNQNGIYAIQLRPILPHEKKIIIGCGNNPTCLYYHYPFSEERKKEMKKNKYKNCNCKNHLHPNCVTIDPNISMNPTIITMFGKCNLPFLNNYSFESIETEGVNLDYFPYFKLEKNRLLISV